MGKGSYGEPDWANPDNTTTAAAATQDAGVSSSVTASTRSNGTSGRGRSSFMLVALSVLDMGLAVMMSALGVLAILQVVGTKITDPSQVFLAAYMIMFAFLLFLYELMWWMAIPIVNKVLRKNFGFLYGLKGKGFYLIFVAFLTLGLGDDTGVSKALTWSTGISFLVIGVFHFFVVCMFPDTADKYQAPTAGLERMGADSVV